VDAEVRKLLVDAREEVKALLTERMQVRSRSCACEKGKEDGR
jgi:hypothetical protein